MGLERQQGLVTALSEKMAGVDTEKPKETAREAVQLELLAAAVEAAAAVSAE